MFAHWDILTPGLYYDNLVQWVNRFGRSRFIFVEMGDLGRNEVLAGLIARLGLPPHTFREEELRAPSNMLRGGMGGGSNVVGGGRVGGGSRVGVGGKQGGAGERIGADDRTGGSIDPRGPGRGGTSGGDGSGDGLNGDKGMRGAEDGDGYGGGGGPKMVSSIPVAAREASAAAFRLLEDFYPRSNQLAFELTGVGEGWVRGGGGGGREVNGGESASADRLSRLFHSACRKCQLNQTTGMTRRC
jgi:hypothetical protein